MAKKNKNRANNGSFSKPTSTPHLNTELLRIGPRPNANNSNQGRRESSRLRGVPAFSHLTGARLGYKYKSGPFKNTSFPVKLIQPKS